MAFVGHLFFTVNYNIIQRFCKFSSFILLSTVIVVVCIYILSLLSSFISIWFSPINVSNSWRSESCNCNGFLRCVIPCLMSSFRFLFVIVMEILLSNKSASRGELRKHSLEAVADASLTFKWAYHDL